MLVARSSQKSPPRRPQRRRYLRFGFVWGVVFAVLTGVPTVHLATAVWAKHAIQSEHHVVMVQQRTKEGPAPLSGTCTRGPCMEYRYTYRGEQHCRGPATDAGALWVLPARPELCFPPRPTPPSELEWGMVVLWSVMPLAGTLGAVEHGVRLARGEGRPSGRPRRNGPPRRA